MALSSGMLLQDLQKENFDILKIENCWKDYKIHMYFIIWLRVIIQIKISVTSNHVFVVGIQFNDCLYFWFSIEVQWEISLLSVIRVLKCF